MASLVSPLLAGDVGRARATFMASPTVGEKATAECARTCFALIYRAYSQAGPGSRLNVLAALGLDPGPAWLQNPNIRTKQE